MYSTLQLREKASVIAEDAWESTREENRVHVRSGRV
jgi:hypothetical protein